MPNWQAGDIEANGISLHYTRHWWRHAATCAGARFLRRWLMLDARH